MTGYGNEKISKAESMDYVPMISCPFCDWTTRMTDTNVEFLSICLKEFRTHLCKDHTKGDL